MDTKGIILWVGFAVICAVIYLLSRRMKSTSAITRAIARRTEKRSRASSRTPGQTLKWASRSASNTIRSTRPMPDWLDKQENRSI